jgi:hypothetical protein
MSHSVEGIDYSEDARRKRNLLAVQPLRVTIPIITFVMRADHIQRWSQQRHGLQNLHTFQG